MAGTGRALKGGFALSPGEHRAVWASFPGATGPGIEDGRFAGGPKAACKLDWRGS